MHERGRGRLQLGDRDQSRVAHHSARGGSGGASDLGLYTNHSLTERYDRSSSGVVVLEELFSANNHFFPSGLGGEHRDTPSGIAGGKNNVAVIPLKDFAVQDGPRPVRTSVCVHIESRQFLDQQAMDGRPNLPKGQ